MLQFPPPSYLHHFNCGHSESYLGPFAVKERTLSLDHPCARCEPNTTIGQERLNAMWNSGRYVIPYITTDGDIVLGSRDPGQSKNCPALLSIVGKGGRYGAKVVGLDSAEGLSILSGYAWNRDGRVVHWRFHEI